MSVADRPSLELVTREALPAPVGPAPVPSEFDVDQVLMVNAELNARRVALELAAEVEALCDHLNKHLQLESRHRRGEELLEHIQAVAAAATEAQRIGALSAAVVGWGRQAGWVL